MKLRVRDVVRIESPSITRRDLWTTSKASRYYSGTIPAGGESTIINITGRGKVKGYILCTSGVSPANVEVTMIIDGETIFTLFMSGIIGVFNPNIASVNVPNYAKPIALLTVDTTNNVYAFSWTTTISFEKSFSIKIKNCDSENDLEYSLPIHIEEEVGG